MGRGGKPWQRGDNHKAAATKYDRWASTPCGQLSKREGKNSQEQGEHVRIGLGGTTRRRKRGARAGSKTSKNSDIRDTTIIIEQVTYRMG